MIAMLTLKSNYSKQSKNDFETVKSLQKLKSKLKSAVPRSRFFSTRASRGRIIFKSEQFFFMGHASRWTYSFKYFRGHKGYSKTKILGGRV